MGTGNPPFDLLAGIYRPLLERFRNESRDPSGTQRARLAAILAANADTDVGRRYGFASISSPEEFRARVPAIGFDEMAADVERIANGERNVLTSEPVLRFVKTSGTTGASKRIPVTASLEREVRDAQMIWLVNLLRENRHHPDGRKLTLVSPADEEATPAGIPIGANTGRMANAMPWFVRLFSAPHRDVLAVRDADVRAYLVTLACAGTDAGTLTTANPSTVWLLAQRLRSWEAALAEQLDAGGLPAHTPGGVEIPAATRRALSRRFRRRREQARRLREAAKDSSALFPTLWPRLTTVNCWRGGASAFYLEKLRPELGSIPVRDPGLCASEGFFAIPLESGTAAGVLFTGGPFFEFEPVDGGSSAGVEGLEEGREYEIRITTCGGLYRYAMKDVIRVVGKWENTPLVEFVRKAGSILSINGEKVSDAQVLSAAAAAARGQGIALTGAGAAIEMTDPPHYLALIETPAHAAAAPSRDSFAEEFDRALSSANVEYAGRRADGRLGAAQVRYVPAGSFEEKRRALVAKGGPETQVKIPVLFPRGW
jgi:hypothetical protein